MTVDMLAAAFIWPEEMLVGRTRVVEPVDRDAVDDDDLASAGEPAEPDPAPFWASLVRRFQQDRARVGTDGR